MRIVRPTLIALVTLASATWTEAARIEVAAAQVATIQPEDSSVSPRILVSWILPEELAGKEVEAAFAQFTLATIGEGELSVDMSPLEAPWTAQGASWTSGWSKDGGDFDDSWAETAVLTPENGGAVTMDVRQLVRDFIAGNRSNFGFILIPDSTAEKRLKSFDVNDSAKLRDAKLLIVYREAR